MKLGVAPIDSSRWLAVAAHAALVVAFGLVAMGGTQSDSSSRRVVPWHRLWLPLAAWLSPLIHYHTDRGLETVLLAVLPCVAGLALAGRQWLTGGILLAMAAITRPEGILYLAALTPLLMREMDAAPDHPDAAPPPIPRREIALDSSARRRGLSCGCAPPRAPDKRRKEEPLTLWALDN